VSVARAGLWVASLCALALPVRSLLIGAVPFGVAVGALVAYLALVLVGVLVPALEMFGDVIASGDPGVSAVALTFDDGPHPVTTRRVLDVLAQAGVTATFFVVGEKAERHPDVLSAIAEGGHTFGVHGYRHRRLYALLPPREVVADIERTRDVVERAVGIRPRWFRPPVGQVSPRTAAGARRAGAPIVVWSARGLDGLAGASPERVALRIEQSLRPGAIILLHDAAEHDDFVPASIEALPRVLQTLERRGLRVVPLSELISGA
jgi:peptidoglycan/xylan/chitin deacetylase (PgdA/CDA1 family)